MSKALPSWVHFGERFSRKKSEKNSQGFCPLRVGDSGGKPRKMILGGCVDEEQLSLVDRRPQPGGRVFRMQGPSKALVKERA